MNLVFPVAGEGSRFGGVFKPFMKIGDKYFIEVTYEPFKKWKKKISSVIFICTEEQNNKFNVEKKLKAIIDHPKVQIIKLKQTTIGPYETISNANLSGSCIVCDCDHSLNVDPIFEQLKSDIDCIIPVWKFPKDEYYNWSKVVSDNNSIKMICEKEKIESKDFTVRGIIGCIYFKDINCFSQGGIYISDCLSSMLKENKHIKTVDIDRAYFYGDPEMLEKHVNYLRKRCSIFCDIDGVLIKHEPHSDCDPDTNHKLPGVEKLKQWRKENHKVVLTTARSEKNRKETIQLLSTLGIEYDELVMELRSGPRIVINDRKPSKLFTVQSAGIELTRDNGISDINIEYFTRNSDIKIVKVLKGNSFAKTYLINDGESLLVRKQIIKDKETTIHYQKLKRQVEDLNRLGFMWEKSTPKIIRTEDNPYEFYYDMEYLNGYVPISNLTTPEQSQIIPVLLTKMNEYIYSFKKEIEGLSWLQKHLDLKIYPKLKKYELNKYLQPLINNEEIVINGEVYCGLRNILSRIDLKVLKPKHLRPIHGDFTLENILISPDKDLKLIDMDSSDYIDAAELDLGKMCQSVLSRYSEWKEKENIITTVDFNSIVCDGKYFNNEGKHLDLVLDQWSYILREDLDTTFMKGAFYMALYFIRFVPFRLEISKEHGMFALVMAIVWLNRVLKEQGK